jgi:Ni,Fe-hydrogenase I large subunit
MPGFRHHVQGIEHLKGATCAMWTIINALRRLHNRPCAVRPPWKMRLAHTSNAHLRNLIRHQHVQDHVVHFYHLHALDWVDGQRLGADAEAFQTAQSISDWPKSSTDFSGSQRQTSGVNADSWDFQCVLGSSAYKLPPEANLMAVAYYSKPRRQDMIRAHAILGSIRICTHSGRRHGNPIDPTSQAASNADRLPPPGDCTAKEFVDKVYLPDAGNRAVLSDWAAIGGGLGNIVLWRLPPTAHPGCPLLHPRQRFEQ